MRLLTDPFGWLEGKVGARRMQRGVRVAMTLVCAAFLGRRISEYSHFQSKPLWAMETLLFAVLVVAYLVRRPPVARARTVAEVWLPPVGALLPFVLLATPPHPALARDGAATELIFYAMTAATFLTLWGLWTLRGSFSITVEARGLVTGGPYRWVRHPVYLGEMGTAGVVAAWRFSALNVALWALFCAVQLVRARLEEKKLAAALPGYGDYAKRAWWFF